MDGAPLGVPDNLRMEKKVMVSIPPWMIGPIVFILLLVYWMLKR
jgi:hypothetical protein